jgi:hypothetical protein
MLCSNCQRDDPKLYRLPEKARAGPHSPDAICHFCFVRLIKRRPMKRELVSQEDDTAAS